MGKGLPGMLNAHPPIILVNSNSPQTIIDCKSLPLIRSGIIAQITYQSYNSLNGNNQTRRPSNTTSTGDRMLLLVQTTPRPRRKSPRVDTSQITLILDVDKFRPKVAGKTP